MPEVCQDVVLRNSDGKDYRTLGISSLSLQQIRQVLSQIGLRPIRKLRTVTEVETAFQTDSSDVSILTEVLGASKTAEYTTDKEYGGTVFNILFFNYKNYVSMWLKSFYKFLN